MYFSKSGYRDFCQCGKYAWLRINKPEEYIPDGDEQSRMERGKMIGELARGYFGDHVNVMAYDEDGELDLAQMVKNTKAEMEKNTPVICEASFSFGGLYCAVDILRREGDGWSIYEVKSSVEVTDIYTDDVAYQKYVLENCGVNISGIYLMNINNKYVFDGTLDIHKLFKITDLSEKVEDKLPGISENLKRAEEILGDTKEPDIGLGLQCSKKCGFWKYCKRNIPTPSVFDLFKIQIRTALGFYNRGIITFKDADKAIPTKAEQNDKTSSTAKVHRLQIDFCLDENKETYVDKENLRKFLDELTYPLYFLDFETFQTPVPKYEGTVPYAQIPFQYSLHYIESEGGELKHKEFLAEPGTDPRRGIAEALCRDIPEDVIFVAYNAGFEKRMLNELAAIFPDLSEHLLNIRKHAKDLMKPFSEGWYFNRRMSENPSHIATIKNVLPSMFPDDPSLDYHNLEGIHNGGEAMKAFPAMESMSPEELAETRKNLLKYCELDTFAMVKVWEALKDTVK